MALSIAKDYVTGVKQPPEAPDDKLIPRGVELDFSVTANNLAQNKTIRILKQPANTRLSKLFYAVRTVEGATATIDIGIGDDIADGLVDGGDANAATLAVSHPALDVVSADTWITLTARNALDAAKIYVEAEYSQAVNS
jgi:hypothetical protein